MGLLYVRPGYPDRFDVKHPTEWDAPRWITSTFPIYQYDLFILFAISLRNSGNKDYTIPTRASKGLKPSKLDGRILLFQLEVLYRIVLYCSSASSTELFHEVDYFGVRARLNGEQIFCFALHQRSKLASDWWTQNNASKNQELSPIRGQFWFLRKCKTENLFSVKTGP